LGKERLVIVLQEESFERLIRGDKVDKYIGKLEAESLVKSIYQNERPNLAQPNLDVEVIVQKGQVEGGKVDWYWDRVDDQK